MQRLQGLKQINRFAIYGKGHYAKGYEFDDKKKEMWFKEHDMQVLKNKIESMLTHAESTHKLHKEIIVKHKPAEKTHEKVEKAQESMEQLSEELKHMKELVAKLEKQMQDAKKDKL